MATQTIAQQGNPADVLQPPLIFALARTLRAAPTALRIAIRFLSRRFAPVHQANAADSRPREQARVFVSR